LQFDGKTTNFVSKIKPPNMNISAQIYNDFKRGYIDSLYAEGFASLKAFAARYLTDNYAMMAEDCVQEAIINTYQTRHTFTTPLQLKAYLFASVRNSCISILRKTTSKANYLSEQQEGYEEELSAAIVEQEALDLLHHAISELPEKYRQIFDLDFEQGLRHAEIARLLGITIDGVTKRKAKMISLLREKLKGNHQMQMLIMFLVI
jgi:RNA polymerase sigma-70 factor (ECF subfamily)